MRPGRAAAVAHEHFHAMIPEGLAEAVVLLLGPVDPGQPVEQEPVAAARGQPPQLGTGAVDQDGPQPANFTVHPVRVRHKYPRHYCRAAADDPTEGVSPFPWLITHNPGQWITKGDQDRLAPLARPARPGRRGRP